MLIQNLDKFYKRVLEILSGNENNMTNEQTDGRTAERTDGRTGNTTPISPPPFKAGHFKNQNG